MVSVVNDLKATYADKFASSSIVGVQLAQVNEGEFSLT